MNPTNSEHHTAPADVCACHRCTVSDNTHQVGMVWFHRAEDDEMTEATWVTAHGGVTRTRERSVDCSNPSPRRQGALVVLSCEQCSQLTAFAVWQHKGLTCYQAVPFALEDWHGHPLELNENYHEGRAILVEPSIALKGMW